MSSFDFDYIYEAQPKPKTPPSLQQITVEYWAKKVLGEIEENPMLNKFYACIQLNVPVHLRDTVIKEATDLEPFYNLY